MGLLTSVSHIDVDTLLTVTQFINPEIPVGPPEPDTTPVFVGKFDHVAIGSNGSETIISFSGSDLIRAGGGDDKVYGNSGNDGIRGEAGNDRLFGGAGNDQIDGGTGKDYIDGGTGNDRLFGGAGIDTMKGGTGNDVMSGGSGDDSIFGGAGDDYLSGNAGKDILQGSDGKDLLKGGQGGDVMTGGASADHFIFDSVQDSLNIPGLFDTITDFERGFDKLDFSHIDANEAIVGNQAFKLVNYGGPNQVLSAGQMTVHFDTASNSMKIEANIDGDRSNELHLELTGNVALSNGDFIL